MSRRVLILMVKWNKGVHNKFVPSDPVTLVLGLALMKLHALFMKNSIYVLVKVAAVQTC